MKVSSWKSTASQNLDEDLQTLSLIYGLISIGAF